MVVFPKSINGEVRKMYKKACTRITATIVIIIALALAITVSAKPQQSLTYIIFVSRFFDVMLPVLAVGALIKYLLTGHQDQDCCKKD